MKFLHIGDLHLGKSMNGYSLEDDQKAVLEQITALAEDEKADAVLIAGDIYDMAVPPEWAVSLLDAFLTGLSDAGIRVLAISGNHDSDERLQFGSHLFAGRGVHIAARFEGKPLMVTLEDAYGPVNFYLMPFLKASQVRHFYPEEEIADYDAAVRTVLSHAGMDPEARNVIAAHQFVAGDCGDAQLSGSEGPAAQHVGLVEKISVHSFDAFDYAALGHIHRPQKMGRETVRYCGSPLKYHVDEAGQVKSVPVVTLREKADVSVELHPLKPLRDLRLLRGPMKELLKAENVTDSDDFVDVYLTDENPGVDLMAAFRAVYPNTLRVRVGSAVERAGLLPEEEIHVRKRSFGELVSDFYGETYGVPISPEELQILRKAAAEEGLIHEAG